MSLAQTQQQIAPIAHQLQHVLRQSEASFDMLVALTQCPCCHVTEHSQQQWCVAPAQYTGTQQLALVKQALESIQQYVASLGAAWEILDHHMQQVVHYLHGTQAHSLAASTPVTDIDQLQGLLAAVQPGDASAAAGAGYPAVAVLQQHLAAFKQLVAAVQQQQQHVVHLLRTMPPCACGHIKDMPSKVDQLQALLCGMKL